MRARKSPSASMASESTITTTTEPASRTAIGRASSSSQPRETYRQPAAKAGIRRASVRGRDGVAGVIVVSRHAPRADDPRACARTDPRWCRAAHRRTRASRSRPSRRARRPRSGRSRADRAVEDVAEHDDRRTVRAVEPAGHRRVQPRVAAMRLADVADREQRHRIVSRVARHDRVVAVHAVERRRELAQPVAAIRTRERRADRTRRPSGPRATLRRASRARPARRSRR